ncbi:unnamed protein product [Allacma fusca]|uniref:Uncharacterized protein n=1 Tax=Allacma fusca TaxID=39272 RepID=A0A8J2K9L5_9HEXA|nr:unnamed protein product [Allacma fusca]
MFLQKLKLCSYSRVTVNLLTKYETILLDFMHTYVQRVIDSISLYCTMEFKVPSVPNLKGSSSVTSPRFLHQRFVTMKSKPGKNLQTVSSPESFACVQENFGAFCSNAWSCRFCQLSGMTSVMPLSENTHCGYEGAFCSTADCCKFCQTNGFITKLN